MMIKKLMIPILCLSFCLAIVSATNLPNVSELPALSANDVWGYLGVIRPFNLTWFVFNQEHYNNGTHKNISADSIKVGGVNVATTTDVTNANISMKSYVDSIDTSTNTSLLSWILSQGYYNSGNNISLFISSNISAANTSMKSYVDSNFYNKTETDSINSSMKSYVDTFHRTTLDPTGFPWNDTSTISFDNATRTFTIGTNFFYYVDGERCDRTTDTIQIDDLKTLHFIYYDDCTSGLKKSIVPWEFEGIVQVATVYWNGEYYALGDERHGMGMDWRTHEYLHETVGTRYAQGLAGTFNNYNFTIGTGEYYDEDIEIELDNAVNKTNVVYRNASGTWFWVNNTANYTYVNASGVYYDNAGVLTLVPTNQYTSYWIFATNNPEQRIISMAGQRIDTTLANARVNQAFGSLSFGTLPLAEMKLLYRIIMRQDSTPYEETTDFRTSSSLPTSNYVATDHGTLTGLNDDDHPQYLMADGSEPMTGNWNTGGYNITANTFLGDWNGSVNYERTGAFRNLSNFTNNLSVGKLCFYDGNYVLNCSYTDQLGSAGNAYTNLSNFTNNLSVGKLCFYDSDNKLNCSYTATAGAADGTGGWTNDSLNTNTSLNVFAKNNLAVTNNITMASTGYAGFGAATNANYRINNEIIKVDTHATGLYNKATVTANTPVNSGGCFGMQNEVYLYGNSSVTGTQAGLGNIFWNYNSAANQIYGNYNSVYNTRGTTTIGAFGGSATDTATTGNITANFFGAYPVLYKNGAGTIQSAVAFYGYPIYFSGSTGLVQNAYGVKINSAYNGTSGVIQTVYGIFVDNQNNAQTNYAVVTNAGLFVINEGGDKTSNFRVEGDTDTVLINTLANSDVAGIGLTAVNGTKLAIRYDDAIGSGRYGIRNRHIVTRDDGTGLTPMFGGSNELYVSGNASYSGYQYAQENLLTYTGRAKANSWGGLTSTVTIQGMGALNVIGSNNVVTNYINAQNTTDAITSLIGQVMNGNGILTTSTGITADAVYNNGAGSIGTGYQLYLSSFENGTGSITNGYMIRARNTLEATNNYFILSDNGQSVFNEDGANRSDFRVESDTQPYMFFVDSETNTVHIGDSAGTAPLTVGINNSGISIWSEGNISAAGVNVRTSKWDEDIEGYSLDKYKKITSTPDGKVNHSDYGVGVVKMKNRRIIGYNNKTILDRNDKTEFYNESVEDEEEYWEDVIVEKERDQLIGFFNETTGMDTREIIKIKYNVTESVRKFKPVTRIVTKHNTIYEYFNRTEQEPIYEEYEVDGVSLDKIVAKHDDTLNYYTSASDVLVTNDTLTPLLKAKKGLTTPELFFESKTYNTSTGKALTKIKSADQHKNPDGSINYTSYDSSYKKIKIYDKKLINGTVYDTVEEKELIDAQDRINVLEQGLWEMKTELCTVDKNKYTFCS